MKESPKLKSVLEKEAKTYLVDILDCPRYLQKGFDYQLILLIPYLQLYGFQTQADIGIDKNDPPTIRLLRKDKSVYQFTSAFQPCKRPQIRMLNPMTSTDK